MKHRVCTMLLISIFALGGSVANAADRTPEQIVKEARAVIREVTIADVKKLVDEKAEVIILDVRDKNELEDGRIPGAINVSRGMLEFKIAGAIPDKHAKIIVYCAVDLRGPLATKTLIELGYLNAANMSGGLKAWKAAGYPLAK